MKEFIEQCIKDQEAINGIRQLYFLEVDPDGERKLKITIQGILRTCEQFPYIPQEAQKKIISDQMVKDQDYDALNSRTVWKWFDKAKDVYWAKAQEPVEEVKVLEPLSEETQRMIRDWQADLLGLQPVPQISSVEIDRLKDEDQARLAGAWHKKGTDLSQFQTDALKAEQKALHIQYIRENYDPITSKPLPTWKEESDWIAERL
jgi:hypothetical protein